MVILSSYGRHLWNFCKVQSPFSTKYSLLKTLSWFSTILYCHLAQVWTPVAREVNHFWPRCSQAVSGPQKSSVGCVWDSGLHAAISGWLLVPETVPWTQRNIKESTGRSRNERMCRAKKGGQKGRDRIGSGPALDTMVLLSPNPDVTSPGRYPLQPSSKIPISNSACVNGTSNQSLAIQTLRTIANHHHPHLREEKLLPLQY